MENFPSKLKFPNIILCKLVPSAETCAPKWHFTKGWLQGKALLIFALKTYYRVHKFTDCHTAYATTELPITH